MFTLNCKGRLLHITKPVVMGIINVTPDSFYTASRKTALDQVVQQAEKMLHDGATMIDLGGQSTRPGSEALSAAQEAERVVPAIEAICNAFPNSIVSVDTFYSHVAIKAVTAGASIVNDISSGTIDAEMLPAVAKLRVPYVAMHMKGTPQTMQQLASYENITLEVLDFCIQTVERCRAAGIADVIIDPGFGFAKTIPQNFELLQNASVLTMLQRPLLFGLSRKATIYKTLHTTAAQALNGTTVLNTIALQRGANILRVHDVKEAMEAIELVHALGAC